MTKLLLTIRNNAKWIMGLALVVCLLFYGIFSPENHVPFLEEEALLSDEPDAFMVNATYSSYGPEGKLESVLTSTQAKHYPTTDTGRLANPKLHLYQNGVLSWSASSKEGEFDVKKDTLTLSGNVVVLGETSDGRPLTMTTETLTYANKSSFINTDAPVKITSRVSEISAVGMTANIDDRTVTLLSRVKGQYEPK